jgi:hypothetical protein
MCDVPGGAIGILSKDYKGQLADRLVTRIDPGMVSLTSELRAHERQASEELSRSKAPTQKTKVAIDATPAVVMLGMVFSKEQLLELKRKAMEAHQQAPRLRLEASVLLSGCEAVPDSRRHRARHVHPRPPGARRRPRPLSPALQRRAPFRRLPRAERGRCLRHCPQSRALHQA